MRHHETLMLKATVVAALAMVWAVSASAPARAQPTITWRVENPFRFFANPSDTEMHRSTYLAMSAEERRSPVLSTERALAERLEEGWAAALSGPVCFDEKDYRFRCGRGQSRALDPGAYINPASHAVIVEAAGLDVALGTECTWATAPIGRRGLRGDVATQPCGEPVRLEVPYPGGITVSLEVGGAEVQRATIRVRDLLIVGMGDSFASGEGNPDFPIRFSAERAVDYGETQKAEAYGGYPARVGGWQRVGDPQFLAENARWLDQACHRSLYSHQLRAALQLAIEDPHRAVTFVGVACSGAEVTSGLFLRYKGHEWVPNPPALSQISAVAEAQCGNREARFQDLPEAYHLGGRIPELQGGLVLRKCDADVARRIDLLLLSIGGNDVGFARLVANAILADQSTLKTVGGWFGQVHGAAESSVLLERLDDRYKALNRALHSILHIPWNESGRVILTGYPRLALLEDGRGICPDGSAGMDVLADFRLSSTRAREGDELAERLNSVMRSSARDHGWQFADRHRSQFLGRGLCAGFTDNALSTADDLRLPRRVDGAWVPYSPANYRAYAPRQRWFRTPNDAFLTANFHVPRTLLQSALKSQTLSWVQILLAATYSGAFHPTAEGQAAMADAVVEKARAVLERYEGRNREK